jgi:hypothetical protein
MLNEHFYVDDKPESVSAPVSQPVVSESVASEPVQVKEEKKNQDEDEVLKDLLDGIDI